MSEKIKVGDGVECIDAAHRLVEGEYYIVSEVGINGEGKPMVQVGGRGGGATLYANRFKKANQTKQLKRRKVTWI